MECKLRINGDNRLFKDKKWENMLVNFKAAIMIKQYELIPLLTQFINAGNTRKRRKADGSLISKGTVSTYENLKILLEKYEVKTGAKIVINDLRKATKREEKSEKTYWKRFYRNFGDFLYIDLKHFDNYVGHNFKMLRVFIKWLNKEKGIFTGENYKNFHVAKEEISIIVLQPEQLNFLINDKEFEDNLPDKLKIIKDIFVFGCTVSLRFSDIKNLKKVNWETYNGGNYLNVKSKKTHTNTRVKLPTYAVDILKRNKSRSNKLLPVPSVFWFNTKLKELMKLAGWTDILPKYRMRRGKPSQVYKNSKPYRFCDHISSHSMRRTGITTMLRMGMDENLVRKISGHKAGSKEFYKYVEISQSYMDDETDKMYEKIGRKQPNTTKNV